MKLIKVEANQKELLFNLFQKMLYEMTQFYDNPIDEKGIIHYGYFDEYFTDPKRIAYFIYQDDTLVGFLMIHPYSYFDYPVDYNLAEFTIFPQFRRRGYALAAVAQLFEMHQGTWEIKFNTKNTKAQNLWLKITKPYNPLIIQYDEYEKVLRFKVGE